MLWNVFGVSILCGLMISGALGYSDCDDEEYYPICGSNYRTFYSECDLDYYNYHHGRDHRIHKLYDGECSDTPDEYEPSDSAYEQPIVIVLPQGAYSPAPAPVSPYAAMLPNGTVVPYFPSLTNYTVIANATNTTVTNYTVTYTYSSGGPFPYPFLLPLNMSALNGTNPNMTVLPPYAAPYVPAPVPNPYAGIPVAPGSYVPSGSPYPAAPAGAGYAAVPRGYAVAPPGYADAPGNPQVMTLVYGVPPPPPQYYANIPLGEYGGKPGYAGKPYGSEDDYDEDDDEYY